MKQKKPAAATPAETDTQPDALRRVSVLISASDYADMQRHFEEGKSGRPVVTVHPPAKRQLTAEQREKRKAYRQRPEVRTRQREYRKQRAAKLRALLAQAKESATATA